MRVCGEMGSAREEICKLWDEAFVGDARHCEVWSLVNCDYTREATAHEGS